MNKILVIGDIHLNELYSLYINNILQPFLIEVNNSFYFDTVVFLGDIFDASSLNNTVSNLIKIILSVYDNKNIYILNGNHDKINKEKTIYDIMMLPSNVTIVKDLLMVDNNIFLPHFYSIDDIDHRLQLVKSYIDDNKYSSYNIFSHNDYNDIYYFKNSFLNISDFFDKSSVPIYLINGHNHVPIYKKYNNLYILNIGCAININFKDTAEYNNFLFIDNTKNSLDKFIPVINTNSIQYYTFIISSSDEIYDFLSDINKDNYKFIRFKLLSPDIIIDHNLKEEIKLNYNAIDIEVIYDLDKFKTNSEFSDDATNLVDILGKLDITVDEITDYINNDNHEKIEILFSILGIMFDKRNTDKKDQDNVISVIKKYMLE